MRGELLGPGESAIQPNAGVPGGIAFQDVGPRVWCMRIPGLPKRVPRFGRVADSKNIVHSVIQAGLPDLVQEVDSATQVTAAKVMAQTSEVLADASFELLVPIVEKPRILRVLKGKPENPDREDWREGNTSCTYELIDGNWCVVATGYTDPYRYR